MTMTDLTTYQPPQTQVVVADFQNRAVQRLAEWAESAQAAHQVAQSLVQTSFVPQAFRGKAGEATAAILAGAEVGLQPMAALKSFDVIQGQAAPRALALRAIVQSYGHEMVLVESTATRCRMKGLRRGSSEWQHVTWTLDRARDLGLLGKDNWKKQPQAMLMARATGELARLIAADAILGIGYTVEELADGGPVQMAVDAETADPAPSGTRRMSRARRAPEIVEAEVEPEPDEPTAPDEPAEDAEPDLIEPRGKQMKALHASLKDAGLGDDRDGALRFISETVGREVESSKDLTKSEASAVLDALKAITATPDADPWEQTAAKVAARDESEAAS